MFSDLMHTLLMIGFSNNPKACQRLIAMGGILIDRRSDRLIIEKGPIDRLLERVL